MSSLFWGGLFCQDCTRSFRDGSEEGRPSFNLPSSRDREYTVEGHQDVIQFDQNSVVVILLFYILCFPLL